MSKRWSTVLVGNDVVDFAASRWEPRVAARAFARFSERVCSPEEQALVAVARHPERMLWALFAAKEAAYKAIARSAPGLVFAHRAFVVSPDLTSVCHQGLSLRLQVRMRPLYVHAVAWTGGVTPTWEVAVLARRDSASAAVRRLAVSVLASRLGCLPRDVRIVREPRAACRDGLGPPLAQVRGERAPLDVSLSHHGRFVGCAWSPCEGVAERGILNDLCDDLRDHGF